MSEIKIKTLLKAYNKIAPFGINIEDAPKDGDAYGRQDGGWVSLNTIIEENSAAANSIAATLNNCEDLHTTAKSYVGAINEIYDLILSIDVRLKALEDKENVEK